MKKTVHENLFIKLTALMLDGDLDVLTLGQKLLELGSDKLTDGGFWVLDCKTFVEFYSPQFREVLGYRGETDFPSVASSWRDLLDAETLAEIDLNYQQYVETKGEHPYYQKVCYPVKGGGSIEVVCSGTIKFDAEGKPDTMFGTHKIIK